MNDRERIELEIVSLQMKDFHSTEDKRRITELQEQYRKLKGRG